MLKVPDAARANTPDALGVRMSTIPKGDHEMALTKYEELCAALDRAEGIKANIKKLFIEKLSDFIGCPADCIELTIDETASSFDPVTFKAELIFKVPTSQYHRLIPVDGISFKHHPSKSPDYQDQASYKGIDVNLAQDATPMLFAILKELQKTLVREN